MRKQIKIFLSGLSPVLTTRLMYFYNFKKPLNLKNPKDINEKLQYLKLKTYYNNAVITQCVDKLRVRDYLQEKGYGQLCAELYGSYSTSEELKADWDRLPGKMVIKCNHGCGYNILIADKGSANLQEILRQLDAWMADDFWKEYCEPQYRFVKKQILVEEYLGDNVRTYKFYCINGQPEAMYVSSNGENGEKDLYLDYFDMDYNWLPLRLDGHQHAVEREKKPASFEEMVKISKALAVDFPFVRVDLYDVDGKVYFSEFTFIPTGGNMKIDPPDILMEWGEKLQLP